MVNRLWPAWLILAVALVCFGDDSARQLARKAQKAEKAGRAVDAYLLYSQAAAADPKNRTYWTKSQALRTRAMRAANSLPPPSPPSAEPHPPAKTDEPPPPPPEPITLEEEKEARRPLPPKELTAPPGRKSFDFRGDAKQVWDKVAKEFGFDLVFDVDYQGGAPFRFKLDDVDYRTALNGLQAATSSFVVPLSDRVFMIYKDTQQKRAEAEPTVAVTLSLPNPVSVQDAQELARAVQQIMEIQRFAIDAGRRLVMIKDKVSKVRAAQAIYEQLLTNKPQVMVEIDLMDTQGSRDLSYGMTLPTQTALSFLGRSAIGGRSITGLRLIPEIAKGFSKFVVVGGGFSTIALAITDASAFASDKESNSRSLFRSFARGVDGQPITLHIGDKYPLITSQYSGGDSISPLAAPPSFNFEDLGISLKITPRVHDDNDISLQVEAEFKVLGGGSLNGIPVIATRKFTSTVRLRDGEWAVLAGLVSSTQARSITGLPILGQLPVLREAFANNSRSTNTSEALVVIKPTIIDLAVGNLPTRAIFTGSEGRWNVLP